MENMEENSIERPPKVVSNERFQQKREEKDEHRPLFPDEIRHEPIDFDEAQSKLKNKIAVHVAKEVPINENFEELSIEANKLITEINNSTNEIEVEIEKRQKGALEKMSQVDPELANFLTQMHKIQMLENYRSVITHSINDARRHADLVKIAEKAREFLNNIKQIS